MAELASRSRYCTGNDEEMSPPNTLYYGDNLDVLRRYVPDASVDLVYLDPPFNVLFAEQDGTRDAAQIQAFDDTWRWDMGSARAYADVVEAGGEVSRSMQAFLKLLLDAVFGALNFRTEIVWKRSSAHSDAKQGRRQHGRIHDVILFYTKSDDHTWTTLYTDYDDAYVEKFYRHVEEGTNRRYQLGDLTGPGGAAKGNPEYEVMGVKS